MNKADALEFIDDLDYIINDYNECLKDSCQSISRSTYEEYDRRNDDRLEQLKSLKELVESLPDDEKWVL